MRLYQNVPKSVGGTLGPDGKMRMGEAATNSEWPLSPTILLRGQQSLRYLQVEGPREGTNGAILKGPFSDCEPP